MQALEGVRGLSHAGSWAEAGRLFLSFCESKGLARGTITDYRCAFARFAFYLRENGGPSCPADLDRAGVRAFTAYLLNRYSSRRGRAAARLSSKTIHNTIVALRTFFGFLAEEGIIPDGIARALIAPPVRSRVIQAMTPVQVQALLAQPKKRTFTGLRDYALMSLLLDSGLRISEALSLRARDVNWQEGVVTVIGKGGKERQVPFGAKVKRELWRYVARRGEVPGQDLLFVTRTGERLKPKQLQSALKRYAEKAGIQGVRVSPHTLRHTFARMWIVNGGDVFSLQRILGHTTMDMVRRYVDLAAGDVAAQHRRFSPMDRLA